MSKSAKPVAEPGLHLVIEVEEGGLRILQAAPIRNASRSHLRPPLLTANTSDRFRAPASELVCALLGRDGRMLESFGWPFRAEAFFDRSIPDDPGGIQGERGDSRQTLRVLRLPVATEAAFLFFYRSDLGGADQPGRWSQTPLALYSLLGPPVPPAPPVPIPGPVPWPLPLPVTPPWKQKKLLRPPHLPKGAHRLESGHIVDTQTIVNNGDPKQRFDVVILGDGFQESELKAFDDQAAFFANSLLALPPFDGVANLINVHTVRTVSVDSGVSDFPAPHVPKRTYYHVAGNFKPGAFNGFFGTMTPQKILDAAELIAPLSTIELMVMLVNVKGEGASAFPDQAMAFTSPWNSQLDFVNYGAHECCHAIARTAEEYIGCQPPDPLKTYPNRATEEQRTAGTVSWKSLAQAQELNAGEFRAIHQFGDPFDATGKHPVFTTDTQRNGMLGLYWGCQDIDPSLPGLAGGCDPFVDPRGKHFYRSMAECKMRRSKFPFCRACAEAISEAVVLATL